MEFKMSSCNDFWSEIITDKTTANSIAFVYL